MTRLLLPIAVLVLAGCRKPHQHAPPPRDAPKVHDPAADNENHYFIVVKRDRFEPASFDVPNGTELILEFHFEDDAPCTTPSVDADSADAVEPGTGSAHVAHNLDVHVRLDPGKHVFRCGALVGTIRST